MIDLADNTTAPSAGPVADPAPESPAHSPSKQQDGRAQSSPRNGARSRGPKTPSGKERSSLNACKHGLYSRRIVLATESHEEYNTLLAYFLETYPPANFEEHELVTDMAHARWRIRRAERHEKGLLNLEMSRALERAPKEFERMDAVTLEALAIQELSQTTALENLHRLAQRYERSYFRSREALLKMRRERGAPAPILAPEPQPEPQPEQQSEPPTGGNEPTSPAPPSVSPVNRSEKPVWKRWMPFLFAAILALVLALPPSVPNAAPAAPPRLCRR